MTDERKTVEKEVGKWNSTKDSEGVFYVVLSDANYPNRLVYKMLEEAKGLTSKRINGSMPDALYGREIEGLVKRYQDPASVDKLAQANAKVEEVKIKLEDNMHQLVNNQGGLDVTYLAYPSKCKPTRIR